MFKGYAVGRVRWIVGFAAVLLAVTAVPVIAAPTPESGVEGPSLTEIPGPTASELASAEREQRERAEWLGGPEAQSQREASLTAYAQLSAGEAKTLLLESFPNPLKQLNADPARVLSELEVEKPLGTYGALVSGEGGETTLLNSSVPVESKLGSEQAEPVDLALEKSGGAYVPQNPLTEVELPAAAEEAVKLEGRVGVQLPATDDHGAEALGEMSLFYPETQAATDTFVAPRAGGVEVFEQLRSPESPERFAFKLSVPHEATLRASESGGAEVVSSSGEEIEEVPPASAVDAQGATVPVSTSVEGDTLVFEVKHHRPEEVAYPVLLDPLFVNDTTSFGEWVPSLNSGYQYNLINGGSSLDAISRGSYWYPAGSHGQWAYGAYGQTSYIAAATFSPVFFLTHTCNTYEPHAYIGLYNPSSGGYDALGVYANGTVENSTYETGWRGNTGTKDAILGIGTNSNVQIACAHELYVGGYSIQEEDPEAPSVNWVAGVPGGWARELTVTPNVSDPGLGVKAITLSAEGGLPQTNYAGCTGANGSRCLPSWETSYGTAYFAEGERSASISAYDPLGPDVSSHVSASYQFTTRLDRQKPEVEVKGEFTEALQEAKEEGEGKKAPALHLPVYNLKIEATDRANEGDPQSEPKARRSGVANIKVFLDGKEMSVPWEAQGCSGPVYSCPMSETYQVPLDEVQGGGVHKLKILATDQVGNERARELEFEYFPATGMNDEYVMQHFPLPDGEGNEAEEEDPKRPELAVNVTDGNLLYRQRDVEVSGPSVDLEVERFYNSQLPREDDTEWGHGWTLAQTPRLEPEETQGEAAPRSASMVQTSGALTSAVGLPTESEGTTFDKKLQATVTKEAGGGYTVEDQSGETDTSLAFDSTGKVTELRTPGYARIDYSYEGGSLSKIAVKDPAATMSSPEEVAEREAGEAEGRPLYEGSFGARGSVPGNFVRPGGMALDPGGDLWVADTGNDRVEEFNPAGEYRTSFGGSGAGEGQLREPAALALDSSGNLWVVDAGNDRVEEFSAEGEFLKAFGSAGTGEGQFSGAGPQGIAVAGNGDIFVIDAGAHRVERFDSSGKFLEAFGAAQLSGPSGLAIGPSGHIWVADAGADKIVSFTEGGQLLRSFGQAGEAEGQLKDPSAVAVNGEGQVFVADTGNGRVQEFSEAGAFLHEFGSREGIKGRFADPSGLAADGKGNVWVAAAGNAASTAGEEAEAPYEPKPREGLIASYSFDEGSGTVAHDDSGHGHEAEIKGAEWTSGKYGQALQFNASQHDELTVPDTEDLRLKGFTLEAWVEPAESREEAPVIAKTDPEGYGYALYAGVEGAPGHPQGFNTYREWVESYVYSPRELATHRWSHLALTSDGKELRLYINGELIGEKPAEEVQAGEGPLQIGGDEPFAHGGYFDGKIDEVRIYNRALSQEEVKEDRDTAIKTPPSRGPVASFSFDEGAGTVAHDDSGHGHDAEIKGAKWTTGRYGSALRFNAAEGDELTVPDSEDLRLRDFTLEAWVQPEESREEAPVIAKTDPEGYGYALYAGVEGAAGHPQGFNTYHEWVEGYVYSPNELPTQGWSHIAVTSDGKHLRLYINGALVDEREAQEIEAGEGPLQIGGDEPFAHGGYFDGKIDEVRVYGRALSEEEIKTDRDTPVSPSTEESTRYEVEHWKTTVASASNAPEDDPRLAVGYTSGLVSSLEGQGVPSETYAHEGSRLSAANGPGGETHYEYDGSERLRKVTLPNGTWGEVKYDTYGRVESVTVSVEGAKAKTTKFKYSTEPRRTTVTPEEGPATIYDIAPDGSVLKWWNTPVPPEIENLSGSLYANKETSAPMSPGDYELLVQAYAPEGIASIDIVANGSQLVDERTCEKTEETSCKTVEDPWVTNTGNWPPGILQLEVIVTDHENKTESAKFWVNIPYTPPPDPEAPEPPTFAEILHFREEFGLDLDLKGNELAIDERIFNLMGDWSNPHTPAGEVARASWERWGVPMRPQDVADMEYREAFLAHDLPIIEQWGEENGGGSYGGYVVNNRAGGLLHVGFSSGQENRVAELKAQLPLIAPGWISGENPPPSSSKRDLESIETSIENALDTNEVLDNNVLELGIDEQADAVAIGAANVEAVRTEVASVVGSGAPVAIYAEEEGQLFSGRNRVSGRIQAGDQAWGLEPVANNETQPHGCTANFGAWEPLGVKPNGEQSIAQFLLVAAHCANKMGLEWARSEQSEPRTLSDFHKIGVAKRTGAHREGQPYETDAAAIRLDATGLIPTTIYRTAKSSRSVGPAGAARHGETLCFSGVATNKVKCGEMVGVRYRKWIKSSGRGRHLFIIVRFAGIHGDSGAPVWNPRTGRSIGILSGGPDRPGLIKDWVTPLVRPRGFSAEKVPGALHAPGMGNLHLQEGS